MAIIDLSAIKQDFKVTAGDDLLFTIRVKIDGVQQPWTGWEIDMDVVKTGTSTIVDELTIGDGIEIQDTLDDDDVTVLIVDGDAIITLPGASTAEITKCKSLSYDIQTINPEGLKRTYQAGEITGKKDITRP